MKVTQDSSSHAAINQKTVESTKRAQESSSKETARLGEGQASRGPAEVEISDNARLMRTANEIAKGAPDIRQEKVAALKKAIQEGSYKVDSEKLAEKILDNHLNADFGKNRI